MRKRFLTRAAIAMMASLLLQGCTSSQQSMVDTFSTVVTGDRDITVPDAQIAALPYSTMYLRLNGGQRIFVVLGYIEQDQSKWLSQDGAMVVTRNGRLMKTVSLHHNLLNVTATTPDPLLHANSLTAGMAWQRVIQWTEEGRYRAATLTSRFEPAGSEVLNIAGQAVPCQIWHENVESTAPARSWRNTFWVDTRSGQVRQSQQMLGAGIFPVELTILKPAP